MESLLARSIRYKLQQWNAEAEIAAARAIQQGKEGTLVTYPTGLQRVRFTLNDGHKSEVAPNVWEVLKRNGGIVYS